MTRPVNVLFTSVGRRVELLRAFNSAFRALDLPGRIIALDADPLAPALRVADSPHVVPRLASPDFVSTLLGICRSEQATLVFPLIDPDVTVLARHAEELARVGSTAMVVDAAAAEIVADKWLTYHWFMSIGVPTPATWLPNDVPDGATYPLFLKPRYGSAGAQCFTIRNERELGFFSEYVPSPVVQEWLPGPEVTTDVVCDARGRLLGLVSRRRIESRGGEVLKGVTVFEEEIAASCARIARELPAVGPITVQGLWKDGRFLFTEINARFGGGVPLGIAAGADSPRWLLSRAAGLTDAPPPLGHYETNVCLTRFDDSFIFPSPLDRAGTHL